MAATRLLTRGVQGAPYSLWTAITDAEMAGGTLGPDPGDMVYRTDSRRLYIYTPGGTWTPASQGQALPLLTGQYYGNAQGIGATAAMVGAGVVRGTPFLLQQDATFDRIGIGVTVVGSTGNLIRLGIYTAAAAPKLVLDAGTVPGDATGVQAATINQALPAGAYMLVAANQGDQTTMPTVRTATSATFSAVPGVPLDALLTGVVTGFSMGNATGAFPATASAALTPGSNNPIVGLRAV